ncbi:hypothetical protein HanIR_Chr15g0753211 [Helianthus annuus]|nr:hypothetical protein HanIR_Chr15g0753211 [Helianthus annuus]
MTKSLICFIFFTLPILTRPHFFQAHPNRFLNFLFILGQLRPTKSLIKDIKSVSFHWVKNRSKLGSLDWEKWCDINF